jgi:hypothetical protein
MKTMLLACLLALLSMPVRAADSSLRDDVIAAARKLADKPNYSWRMTVVVPETAQFKPGPTEGKLEKDGYTTLEITFGDNTTKVAMKGDKAAATNLEGEWLTTAEIEAAGGPGGFLARMIRVFKAPPGQATELANGTKELKKDGEVITGDLTEEGAKAQFRFGTPTNPKGWVKFWIKDGVLTKFEFKVTGKVDFNGNEIDVDRDTTVEIKDVGTTKVEVPEAAKTKLM